MSDDSVAEVRKEITNWSIKVLSVEYTFSNNVHIRKATVRNLSVQATNCKKVFWETK